MLVLVHFVLITLWSRPGVFMCPTRHRRKKNIMPGLFSPWSGVDAHSLLWLVCFGGLQTYLCTSIPVDLSISFQEYAEICESWSGLFNGAVSKTHKSFSQTDTTILNGLTFWMYRIKLYCIVSYCVVSYHHILVYDITSYCITLGHIAL